MSQVIRTNDPIRLPFLKGSAVVGVLLALAAAVGIVSSARWSLDPRRFSYAYLTSLVFVVSLAVGALAWVMFHHLTGAVWSVVLRRLMENLARPLPWIALLFVPIALNLGRIYGWAQSARLAADPALARKAVWLNPFWFNIRAAFYLLCWAALIGLLARSSSRQDTAPSEALGRRMRATSALGMIVLGLTTTFAAFDWLMSLDGNWLSTMFGVYFWAGSLLGSLAALILLVLAFRGTGWLARTITIDHLHDLAKLLFGFVIFWAYIAFSQYFLIWYANMPEETRWFVLRRAGSWNEVSWALVFGQFVVPFFLLLSRRIRRNPFWLGFVSIWLLVFHYVDLYWLIMPALDTGKAQPSWLDASVLLMFVLVFGAIVARACQARPLIPVGDPHLAESLAFRNS